MQLAPRRISHIAREGVTKSGDCTTIGSRGICWPIQLCTWPHFCMSYGRASILLAKLLPSGSDRPSRVSQPPSCSMVTSNGFGETSLVAISLFPAGPRSRTAVCRPTFKIVSDSRASLFLPFARFPSMYYILFYSVLSLVFFFSLRLLWLCFAGLLSTPVVIQDFEIRGILSGLWISMVERWFLQMAVL